MEYLYMLKLIKHKLHIVIIVTTLFIIIGTLYSVYIAEPVFKSSTKLIFKTETTNEQPSMDYNQTLRDIKITQTYNEILKSDTVLSKVVAALKINLTIKQISNMVTIENIPDTVVIKVTVSSSDPKDSANIANAIPNAALDELKIMDVTSIKQIDIAKTPNEPEPYVNRNIIIAAILGFIMSIGYIIIVDYLDTTFKSESDIREKLGLNVLAVLPNSKSNNKNKRK